jgi:hypothetical protein
LPLQDPVPLAIEAVPLAHGLVTGAAAGFSCKNDAMPGRAACDWKVDDLRSRRMIDQYAKMIKYYA